MEMFSMSCNKIMLFFSLFNKINCTLIIQIFDNYKFLMSNFPRFYVILILKLLKFNNIIILYSAFTRKEVFL